MSNGSNNPENTNPTTAALKPTEVLINGTTFDLRNMSLEDAARLRQALPADYRERADALVPFIENFDGIIQDLPEELRTPEGLNALFHALSTGGETALTAAQRTAMRGPLGDMIRNAPGYQLAQNGEKATNFIDSTFGSFADGVMFMFRARRAAGGSLTHSADITHEQAVAVASAYQAAMYMGVETNRRDPSQIDRIFARMQSTTDGVVHALPPQVLAILPAILKFFENGFKDWSGAWDHAVAQVERDREDKPALNYEQTLERNTMNRARANQRPAAQAMMEEAGTVAGVAVKPIVDALSDETVVAGNDGKVYTTNPDAAAGQAPAVPVVTPQGGDLTTEEVNGHQWDNALGALKDGNLWEKGAMLTGLGTAGLGAFTAARGVAEGAVREWVGPRSLPARRAQRALDQAQDLHERAAAAREGRGWRFWERGEEAAKRLEAREARLAAQYERLAPAAESRIAAGTRVNNLGGTRAPFLNGFIDQAVEPLGRGSELGTNKIGSAIWHAPRNLSRGVGGFFSGTAEHVVNLGERMTFGVARQARDNITDIVEHFRGNSPAPNLSVSRATDVVQEAADISPRPVAQAPVTSSRAQLLGSASTRTAEAAGVVAATPQVRPVNPAAGAVHAADMAADAANVAAHVEGGVAAQAARTGLLARWAAGATSLGSKAAGKSWIGTAIAGVVTVGAVGLGSAARAQEYYQTPSNRRQGSAWDAARQGARESSYAIWDGVSGDSDWRAGDNMRGSTKVLDTAITMGAATAVLDGTRRTKQLDRVPAAQVAAFMQLIPDPLNRENIASGVNNLPVNDPLLKAFMDGMGTAVRERQFGRNMGAKVGTMPVSEREARFMIDRAARAYLADGGTVENAREALAQAALAKAAADAHQRAEARREQPQRQQPRHEGPNVLDQMGAAANDARQAVSGLVERSVTVGIGQMRQATANFQLPKLEMPRIQLPFGN